MAEPRDEPGDAAAARPLIDAALVRRLVDSQFPHWSALPVTAVEFGGVDNRTFRLGDELTVRLPSADWYALQVAKEQRWLPLLAPALPLPIPTPVARGVPGQGYPYDWSVYRWIEGRTAGAGGVEDLETFAADVARFLVALQGVDATGGPAPGPHNFFRGGFLTTYAEETHRAIETLGSEVDGEAAWAVWDTAVRARWTGKPVWFHGDIAVGNLLVRDGRLSAVIDFGTSGVGDPSCDVVIAWTLFSGRSRDTFRNGLAVDAGTWARGRGWAIWKALISLVGARESDPVAAETNRRVISEVLADFASTG